MYVLAKDLTYVCFTGSIPYSIGCLTSVGYLNLNDNNLIGNNYVFSVLAYTDCNCTIIGSIPNSIGYLTTVNTLSVGGNCLIGNVEPV